jgi:CYTH domain-containing protein
LGLKATFGIPINRERHVPNEIEHKYLVLKEVWRPSTHGVLYRQGYLTSTKECAVRVRIAGDRAYLTVKGPTTGVTRLEFKYPIPIDDAATMLEHLCQQPLIEKTRYREEFEGHRWEVDEFHCDNSGLVIAEIELANDSEKFAVPSWAAAEVSDDPRYFNAQSVQELEDISAQRWQTPKMVVVQ